MAEIEKAGDISCARLLFCGLAALLKILDATPY